MSVTCSTSQARGFLASGHRGRHSIPSRPVLAFRNVAFAAALYSSCWPLGRLSSGLRRGGPKPICSRCHPLPAGALRERRDLLRTALPCLPLGGDFMSPASSPSTRARPCPIAVRLPPCLRLCFGAVAWHQCWGAFHLAPHEGWARPAPLGHRARRHRGYDLRTEWSGARGAGGIVPCSSSRWAGVSNPNAVAGAFGPYPRMAGSPPPSLGDPMTGSALYGTVGHGSAAPLFMATAIASSG